MRRGRMLAVVLAAVTLLAGCSKFSPEETAVSVNKDGEITAAIIEELDKDYYKEDELKASVEQAVKAYNAELGTERITIDKYEAEERNVTLFMKYAAAEDYESFNNVKFFQGDMVGATAAGYDFDQVFFSVEKGEVKDRNINGKEVMSSYNYNLLILEEEMSVEVPGDIVYVSSNVEVLGKKTAQVQRIVTVEEETEKETEEIKTLSPMEAGSGERETAAESEVNEVSRIAYIVYE